MSDPDKQWGNAVWLAPKLSQPFTALKIIKKLSQPVVKTAVMSLDKPVLDQLLGYTVKWNITNKHFEAA